jgi:hypothetical protein
MKDRPISGRVLPEIRSKVVPIMKIRLREPGRRAQPSRKPIRKV